MTGAGRARRRRSPAGEPYRVAFWAGSFERAGTQQFLVELLRRIDRARFAPVVMSTLKTGELLREIEAMDIAVHEFGTGRSLGSPRTIRGLMRAVRFLKRERIDILSSMLGIVTLMGPWVGRAAGVPVVVNNQRNLTYWFRGGLKERVYRFVNRHLVDAVLVNSSAAAEELVERFGAPRERIVELSPGVDLSRFDEVSPPADLRGAVGGGESPVVGIVAKLSPVKGHEHLLRAAARVLRRRGDVVFLIVGDGPLRADLENLARELGIAESVVFSGVRDDIPGALSLMDVFVLSSLSEGSPNVVLEAMAAGLPVVATRVGGVPDMVRDGETGILVPPGEDEALAEGLLALLEDPERARDMGRRGREVVRASHDIDRVVEHVEREFTALMEAGR